MMFLSIITLLSIDDIDDLDEILFELIATGADRVKIGKQKNLLGLIEFFNLQCFQ